MIDYDLAYRIASYPLNMTSSTRKIVLEIHNVLVFQEVSHDLLCQKPFLYLEITHAGRNRIKILNKILVKILS